MATVQIMCTGLFLALALAALPASRRGLGRPIVYGGALGVSVVACIAGGAALLAGSVSVVTLPFGLPWPGMNFRIDALAAFFLVVVNFGGAAASLYSLGYDVHETAPYRVRPFFPAFLAAMNLVVMAD